MPSAQAKVYAFLSKVEMHPQGVVLEDMVDFFQEEMKRGLAGEQSSLAMIPAYIDPDSAVVPGKKAAVIDAGGTNLRVALSSFREDGTLVVENYSKHPMPGTQGEVSSQEFFAALAGYVSPLLEGVDKIGFCFSYPTRIFPDKDGELLSWSKEMQAPQVVGQRIGTKLREALAAGGIKKLPQVVLLNDTAATLLAGKAAQGNRSWGGYVGFILGTGLNCCYSESNTAVTKMQGLDPQKHQIINTESGFFPPGPRGRGDEALDAKTARPGESWLEKMTSGGYFGALVWETLVLAGKEGLFSPGFIRALGSRQSLDTKDADNYTHNPGDPGNPLAAAVKQGGTPEDALRLWHLIDALLERAARLTAGAMAAVVLKGGGGDSPLSPVCLTVDGTTYYAYYRFRDRVEAVLRPFVTKRRRYYEFVRVEEAPLRGAATAALTP